MKMKGTALAILMSLAMVFAMMPMMAGAAYADSEVVDAGIKYTLHDNGEATVSGHTDALQDSVIIPDKIKSGDVDYAVTSIGGNAFQATGLTSISIPGSVTSIGDCAFSNCSNLGTVAFAEGSKLESIGEEAFFRTGLTSITFPESVTSIGDFAFYQLTNLGTVEFAEGSKLESIGDYAFRGSGITSITIPESVTNIGESAFFECKNLGTVTFAEGSKLESIGGGAFEKTGITSIILPEGITVLSEFLFYNCNSLKAVSIPSTVNEIETWAFEQCNALEKIYFGGSMSQWDAITGEGKPEKTPILCVYAPAGKTLIYNGEEQTGVDSSEGYTLSGTVSAKAAGSYQATATLNEGNIWSDGTTKPKTINWKINKAAVKVTVPTGKTLTYDGQEQTGVEAGEGYTLDGASATNAGSYTATATLKENPDPNYVYEWSDGTTDPKTIDWKIDKAASKVTEPAGKTLTYNGKEQTGVEAGEGYTLDGSSATNAGSYTATATLKENPDPNYVYEWSDGTTDPKTIDWKIDKAASKVTAPAGKTLTYNGQEQAGVEAGEGYTLDGASATDAGTYTATATIKEDPNYVYEWSDGTTDPRAIDWKIEKANNPLSIKGKTAAVKSKKLKKKAQKLAVTKVITFTKKGQGKLTYTKASGNKKITISKTTGKVTVRKGLKKGTYKVKVKVNAAGNSNYNASTWKTATFKIKVK